jgi:predicted anti-sigma-YlaC factor YlaD
MKNMRVCEWFDRFRDGELDAVQQAQFQSHLSECSDCRGKVALLNNMVHALRLGSAEAPLGFPERVARRAFTRRKSWDVLVVYWLRPAPVLAALIVALFIFSSLLLIPGLRSPEPTPYTYGEYETLVNESYGLNAAAGNSQVRSDDDLFSWLEQEGGLR